VEFKWRCPKCYNVNKVDEHKKCTRCSTLKELSEKELIKERAEEAAMLKEIEKWGNPEELEEQREDILDIISELEIEATSIFICYGLEKLIMILGNILKSP
jgi:hypothetical protein